MSLRWNTTASTIASLARSVPDLPCLDENLHAKRTSKTQSLLSYFDIAVSFQILPLQEIAIAAISTLLACPAKNMLHAQRTGTSMATTVKLLSTLHVIIALGYCSSAPLPRPVPDLPHPATCQHAKRTGTSERVPPSSLIRILLCPFCSVIAAHLFQPIPAHQWPTRAKSAAFKGIVTTPCSPCRENRWRQLSLKYHIVTQEDLMVLLS